jgi:hypothetical protein
MVGQAKRLAESGRLPRRDRWVLATLAAVLLTAALGVALYAALSGGSTATARGCIDVTQPSTMGGAQLRACGADADRICADALRNTAAAGAEKLQSACRRR